MNQEPDNIKQEQSEVDQLKSEYKKKMYLLFLHKKRMKAIKRNIPKGYISTSAACERLKISKQRLFQVLERLTYKKFGKGRGLVYIAEASLDNYKPFPNPIYKNKSVE